MKRVIFALLLLFPFFPGPVLCQEDDYDDVEDYADEVIEKGSTSASSSWSPPLAQSNPLRPQERQLSWSDLDPRDFQAEFLALAFLLIYVSLHYYGRRVNLKLATSWLQSALPVLSMNFAHVGDDKKYTLIRDGPNDFIFYASGREYVQKLYGFIKLVPRFDLVSFIMSTAGVPSKSIVSSDTVVLDLELDFAQEGMVFAILDKKKAQKLSKVRYDLSEFAVSKSHPRLPKDHFVMVADCPDFASHIMDQDWFVQELWTAIGLKEGQKDGKPLKEPLIESIILTDQLFSELPDTVEELRTPHRKLTMTLKLQERSDPSISASFVQLIMDFVDAYSTYNILGEARTKLKKVRQAAEDKVHKKQEEKRKEELARLKQEALKKKEDDIGKLSAAEQRKYQEKKQKEEMKKRLKKGKITM